MKKLVCTILALCLLGITAFADVAWEPENSFYQRNQRKCEAEERTYWVNGEAGYVTIREEPEGKPLVNVKNGVKYYVYGTYTKDGETWGLVNYNVSDDETAYLAVSDEVEPGWTEAWVPMADMVLYYDQQSFREDHPGEIIEQEKAVAVDGKALCYYEYPCGPLNWQMEKKYMQSVDPITVRECYVDSDGKTWGYVSYWRGNREVWICLDDPENPDLQTENHTPELIPAAEGAVGTALPEWEASEETSLLYVAIGVAAVCGVTAVLIFRMRKKKASS